MNRINWIAVAVFAIVALLVFLIGVSLLGGWRYGNWGMMGPGMMGGLGYGSFGWIGMIFMWLVPISLTALLVLGIVWLMRAIGSGGNPASPRQFCPSCGRAVQADWHTCPYCGETTLPSA